MARSIEAMLENLEDVLEAGLGLPLSGGKRAVDIDEARDIIDEIRMNMPDQILQATSIVQDKNRIILQAKREANEIVKKAEERAKAMLNEQEIIAAAQIKAKEIVANANAQANELKTTVTKYCDNMLKDTQDQLQKSFAEIKAVRDSLK